MSEECIFCKISSGKIQSPKVYEDSTAMVTFELNPASLGHMIVISKEHAENFTQMDGNNFVNYSTIVRFIQTGLNDLLKPKGFHVLTNGGEVKNQQSKHLVTHIIPVNGDEELVMGWTPKKFEQDKLTEIAKKLTSLQMQEEKKVEEVIKKQTESLFKVVKGGKIPKLKP